VTAECDEWVAAWPGGLPPTGDPAAMSTGIREGCVLVVPKGPPVDQVALATGSVVLVALALAVAARWWFRGDEVTAL